MTMTTLDGYDIKSIHNFLSNLLQHIMDKTDGELCCIFVVESSKERALAVAANNASQCNDVLLRVLMKFMEDDKDFQNFKKTIDSTPNKDGKTQH